MTKINLHSLQGRGAVINKIDPLLIILQPKECLYTCIRIAPVHLPDTLRLIEFQWGWVDPGYEFEHEFLDDCIDRRY